MSDPADFKSAHEPLATSAMGGPGWQRTQAWGPKPRRGRTPLSTSNHRTPKHSRRVAATDGPKNEKKFIEHIVLLNPVTERPGATEPTVPLAQPTDRAQGARRRARCPSLPHTCRAAHRHRQTEGSACASTVDAIDSASSTGTGTYLSAVPVDGAHRVPCDAGPPREPSRRVCSLFRKSKRFHSK